VAFLAGALALALAAGGPALADQTSLAALSKPANPWTICAKATNLVEREEAIPRQLLRAISKIESGRFHPRKQVVMAWPWTVMAEGRGRYLASKEDAIAEVVALQAKGVRNIDVGCMQINLRYHPDAFRDLEEAFDPVANVRYSALFLKSLVAEHRTWSKAVAYYHSGNPDRYVAYRSKVRQAWRAERKKYLAALANAAAQPAEPVAVRLAVAEMPPAGLAGFVTMRAVATAIPHHPPTRAVMSTDGAKQNFDVRFVQNGPLPAALAPASAMIEASEPAFGRDGPIDAARGA
jgi:hypothetical protein